MGEGMKEILAGLVERAGIRGAVVVTHDGVMVTHSLKGGLDEELLAVLSSSLIQITVKSLSEAKLGGFDRFVLTARYGKLVLMDLDFAYLVVAVDRGLDLDRNMIEICSAARKLKRVGVMKPV